MKGTLDAAAFELNKFIKYSLILKSWKKNEYSPKRKGAFNRSRKDSPKGHCYKALQITGISFKSCAMEI